MEITLTKTRLYEGHWEGVLTCIGASEGWLPSLVVTHLGTAIDGVSVTEETDKGQWRVRVPIPADRITDGVQTFLISDRSSGETLASFAIYAGDALAEDIRAEIGLLRAELDMLKRAFRRHCVETA